MRSSMNGVVPFITIFGRKRDIGNESFPFSFNRRFSSSSEAAEAIKLHDSVKRNKKTENLSSVQGRLPVVESFNRGRHKKQGHEMSQRTAGNHHPDGHLDSFQIEIELLAERTCHLPFAYRLHIV